MAGTTCGRLDRLRPHQLGLVVKFIDLCPTHPDTITYSHQRPLPGVDIDAVARLRPAIACRILQKKACRPYRRHHPKTVDQTPLQRRCRPLSLDLIDGGQFLPLSRQPFGPEPAAQPEPQPGPHRSGLSFLLMLHCALPCFFPFLDPAPSIPFDPIVLCYDSSIALGQTARDRFENR